MQTTISWEGDKLVCVQKGEIEGRGWTHWVEGDELHLVRKTSATAVNINDGAIWILMQTQHNLSALCVQGTLFLDFVLKFSGHSPCNYMSCMSCSHSDVKTDHKYYITIATNIV